MAKIKANEALVKALQAWDIDHLYGIPGDSIDAVVDSLRTVRDQFKFYHVRHEEVASLAAGSYTKITGKIGVALSIGGPGLVHLLNGMYDAKMDSVPQLIISGQTNDSLLGTGAFQETNLSKLCEDVAVYNHQIQKGDNVFEVVNEAIRTAYEKKGVAVVICPNDLLTQNIKDTTDKPVNTTKLKAIAPKFKNIKKAAKLINKSKKPVVLFGVGAQHAKDELRELIENAKTHTSNLETFSEHLEEKGVKVKLRGETISYKPENANKWVRGRTLGSDYEKGAIDDEHERHQEQQREPDYADGFKVNWDAIEQHTEQLKQRRIERAQKTKQANRKVFGRDTRESGNERERTRSNHIKIERDDEGLSR